MFVTSDCTGVGGTLIRIEGAGCGGERNADRWNGGRGAQEARRHYPAPLWRDATHTGREVREGESSPTGGAE